MFARSTVMGNAKASTSGTGNKYGSHAFFLDLNANEVSPEANCFMKVLRFFLVGLLALLSYSCSNEPENPNAKDFDFSLDKTQLTLEVNSNATLNAIFDPADVENTAHEWRSSNPNVATVSETGEVKAVSQGQATITATALANNKKASCEVKVVDKIIAPTSITMSSTEEFMLVGDKLTLSATIRPENANDRSVRWMSDNTGVATVDDNGNVEAHDIGVTEITATTSNNKSAKCKITVGNKGVDFSNLKVDVLDDSSVKISCSLTPRGVTVTEAGICIDKNTTPTISSTSYKSSSTTMVSGTMSKLDANTHYFVRIYAKSGEDVFYSSTSEFTTQGAIVTNFKVKYIYLDKLVFETPVIPGVDLNVCYGIAPNPEITDNLAKVSKNDKYYTITLEGLSEGHKYYLRAYTLKDGKPKYYKNEGSAATIGFEGQTIKAISRSLFAGDGNYCGVKITSNLPQGTYEVSGPRIKKTAPKDRYDGENYVYIEGGEQTFFVISSRTGQNAVNINFEIKNIETGVIYYFRKQVKF